MIKLFLTSLTDFHRCFCKCDCGENRLENEVWGLEDRKMCETSISNLLGKITVIVVICCCSLSAQAKYGGGTGEPNDPYLIYTSEQMNSIGADPCDWDKCFKLMADVDLGQFDGQDGREEFNMIGEFVWQDPNTTPFTGVFEGNGNTITNFTYTSTGIIYIGL